MKSTEVQTLGELRVWGTANGWAGPISMRLPAVCRYRTQLFQENRPFIYEAGVILKLLVSLMGRFVACSARISVDTHTDRQDDYSTLAAHARRGLTTFSSLTSTYSSSPCQSDCDSVDGLRNKPVCHFPIRCR